ncbi:MAG: hypothetical protein WBF71_09900 [Microthrixaceae bacterium]
MEGLAGEAHDDNHDARWSHPPAHAFAEFLDHQMTLLNLTRSAIASASQMLELREAVNRRRVRIGEDPSPTDDQIAWAKLADVEMLADFTNVHAAAVMVLWGGLEAFVDDLVIEGIVHEPAALVNSAIASTKVPLRDFVGSEPRDLARLIVDHQKLSKRERGVSRFNAVLGLIGLDGEFRTDVKSGIWEMMAVRNLVAHRRGIVDSRFLEDVPGYGQGEGEAIVIDAIRMNRYWSAVVEFGAELCGRIDDMWENGSLKGSS